MSRFKYRINPLGIIILILIGLGIYGYTTLQKNKLYSNNRTKLEEFSLKKVQEFANDEMDGYENRDIMVESYKSYPVQADKDRYKEEIVTIEFVPIKQDQYDPNKYYAILLVDLDKNEIILKDRILKFDNGWHSINTAIDPFSSDLNDDDISEFHVMTSVSGIVSSNKTLNVFDLQGSKLTIIWNRDKVSEALFNSSLKSYFIYYYDWQLDEGEGRLDPHHVIIDQIDAVNFDFILKKKLYSENKVRLMKENLAEVLANSRQILLK